MYSIQISHTSQETVTAVGTIVSPVGQLTTEPEQADNGFKTLGGVDIPPGGKIDPSKSLTADFESAVFGK
jgi:hypothetical protein